VVIDALGCGKHVLVEKPIAVNVEEAEKMLRAATAAGLVLYVGMTHRFYPELREAKKLVDDAGPLTGKTFKYTHIDSWEIGVPTWTNKFIPEFRERRGYDPTKYLPALAGKKLDTPELADRFTWDYRRTVADLIAENYYGRLSELSARHGLGIHPESGGPYYDQFMDALQILGISDVPMAEFWSSRDPVRGADGAPRGTTQGVPSKFFHTSAESMPEQFGASVRQAASAAHIYGKPVNQAEAFTNFNHDWSEDPYFLKTYGDRAFCRGVTRNVLCFFVHQSTLTDIPGYQWEHVGTHFDRNVTWWPKSSAWLAYLARCQHLLRQGRFVADLAAYGQTEHSRGLWAALRTKPEVIFLLTDGGDPVLDPGQLRLIRDEAAGRTSIHCLHFGRGPRSESKNFLARLAAENRGSYVYIDMNTR
jgi:hypothetical protein